MLLGHSRQTSLQPTVLPSGDCSVPRDEPGGDISVPSPAARQAALPEEWDISTRSGLALAVALPAGPASARHLRLNPLLLL